MLLRRSLSDAWNVTVLIAVLLFLLQHAIVLQVDVILGGHTERTRCRSSKASSPRALQRSLHHLLQMLHKSLTRFWASKAFKARHTKPDADHQRKTWCFGAKLLRLKPSKLS